MIGGRMRFRSSFFSATFLAGLALLASSLCASAQQTFASTSAATSVQLPDEPQPQVETASAELDDQQAPNPAPAQAPAAPGSSSAQAPAQPPVAEKSQHEKAEEQIKEQEKQRVEGIIPTFNVSYRHDAVPLSPGQKFDLSFHSSIDPFAFASAFLAAGYHEADNDLVGFPWGPKGFFERSGIAYLDTFNSNILSTGVVPVLFRQDPRYFRLGYGSKKHRILYSMATNFMAKNDYNGKWSPNYGNLLGNFAAGEISNLYYPAGNSGFGLAATGTVIQIAEGAGGSIFNEFWPDISRKFFHKDPTHGLDAQANAEYKARKDAEKNAAKDAAASQK